MKLMSVFTLGLALVGCATDAEESSISSAEREQLATLGVLDVEERADRYVLSDGHDTIGEVQLGSELRASLFDEHVTLAATKDFLAASCNGASATLTGTDGSLPISTAGDLASCNNAFRAVDILAGANESPAVASDGLAYLPACETTVLNGCVDWRADGGCAELLACYVEWCSPFEDATYRCVSFRYFY